MPVLVLAESAIDVMSYYQMQPQPGFSLSFAGTLSGDQQELLCWVVNRYQNVRVVVVTDADRQGDTYAELMCQMRSDTERDRPPVGKDWNDTLNNREARQ